MQHKEIPLHIPGINESPYAGFPIRLASLLLDGVISLPVVGLILYLNTLGPQMHAYTIIPNIIFSAWYFIYLPSRFGGTPAKLLLGMTIVRTDATRIALKEAFLRYSVYLLFAISGSILTAMAYSGVDEETYLNMNWYEQLQYIDKLAGPFFNFQTWLNYGWIGAELIIFLANPRRRAVHDFIAGTVVIKSQFIDKIWELMYQQETPSHEDSL